MVLPPLIHGTLREHYVLLFAAAGSFALISGAVGAWIGAHFGARRLARRLQETQSLQASQAASEFALLRESLESIAIEVERVTEGQRFAARLLSERGLPPSPLPASRRAPGETTPH